ncbi:MAG: AAA family ATPase, partial [Rhodopirellula sp.]|nr:AAA family ATPase [Rhodopirellula sp.]
MPLADRLTEYIAACFTGLWIESHEHEDALRELARMCHDEHWQLATWNVERGLRIPGAAQSEDGGGTDPLAAIRSINALATPEGSTLLILENFHRFLGSPEMIQALAQQITQGKQNRTFLVVLSPIVQIPTELEKLFVVVEHDLPGRQQLEEIARSIATEEGELPDADEMETVLDAAAGLTRFEAEGAFSLSLVRHRRVQADTIWELKAGMLKKSGLMQLYRGGERFDGLGGLLAL